jgi:predicted kinase
VNKRKLILTVGLPRSGKSTWAQQQGFSIVCPDAIRLALHGERYLAKPEPMVWLIVYIMVDALFLAGNDTIIIDATNTNEKRRREWKEKFPNVEIELKVFDTSPAECKRRAVDTGQPDLLPVIDRMAAQWDLPKPTSWLETA